MSVIVARVEIDDERPGAEAGHQPDQLSFSIPHSFDHLSVRDSQEAMATRLLGDAGRRSLIRQNKILGAFLAEAQSYLIAAEHDLTIGASDSEFINRKRSA